MPATTRGAGPTTAREVVAALLAERRRIAMAFRAAGAVAPDRATSLEAIGLRYDRQIDYLVRLGVIHDVERGYWLDDARYERTIEQPRFRSVGVLLVAALVMLAVVTLIGVVRAG